MPEYEIAFTLCEATVTVKFSDPAFTDKWWNPSKPSSPLSFLAIYAKLRYCILQIKNIFFSCKLLNAENSLAGESSRTSPFFNFGSRSSSTGSFTVAINIQDFTLYDFP
jgi:hypothetical protein